jgi:ABC-type polysaccharide/polyol phosphate transport system ATPase subunit
MHKLLKRARAVVTVTHDTDFVRSYCSKAILLEHGQVLHSGSPDKAVLMYLDLLARNPNRSSAVAGEP